MQPHPDCFFQRHAATKCVNLEASAPSSTAAEPGLGFSETEASPAQWRILREHIKHALVALPWKAWKTTQQRRLWNRTAAAVRVHGADSVLLPSSVVNQPCLMIGCDSKSPAGLGGHQCLPGATTLFSLEMARAVNQLQS